MFYSQLGKALAMAKRKGFKVGLLYLDLDEFKPVNDKYGHQAGDKLLKKVGRKILSLVRKADYVCRVGGDEFAIIIEMFDKNEDLAVVAEKILASLGKPFEVEDFYCEIGASIGISSFPDNAEDVDQLVRRADKAMYAAKSKGKNQFSFCEYENKDKEDA